MTRPRVVLAPALWAVMCGAALHCAATATLAGTFDVKGVEVTKGESELAFGAAWQRGFPINSDLLRHSYEASYSYGLTSWFKSGVKLGFEQPDSGDLDATNLGFEAQAVLIDPSKRDIGIALFGGIDFGLLSGTSDAFTVGPLVSFKLAKDLSLTLNPLFQKSWDPSTPGIDFTYAWQVRREISDSIGIGVEGYGTVPDIGHAPPVDFQEHRLGPVIYLSHEVKGEKPGPMKLGDSSANAGAGGGKIELQIGVLFGTTEATAHTTGRAKLAITW